MVNINVALLSKIESEIMVIVYIKLFYFLFNIL